MVSFRDFLPGDAVQIVLQVSQHRCLGLTRPARSYEDGEELAAGGPAWTAIAGDGRILCCAGFTELWPGRHVVAWALLAERLGAAQLAITRFARERIAEAPFARIEAIVRADRCAECTWARLVGLSFVAALRNYGGDSETHLLFERIR